MKKLDLIFKRNNHRKLSLFLFDGLCFLCLNIGYVLADNVLFANGYYGGAGAYMLNAFTGLVLVLAFRALGGIYKSIWRYASAAPYLRLMISDIAAGLVSVIVSYLIGKESAARMTVTVAMAHCIVSLFARFLYQTLYKKRKTSHLNSDSKINVAIVGAGHIGVVLAEELMRNKNSNYNPIAFIDKDKSKQGSLVCGLKVYSDDDSVIEIIKKKLPVQEIFIALPYIESEAVAEIYNFYKQTGCKIKIYDTGVKDVSERGKEKRRTLRELQIEDLLFREQVDMADEATVEYYKGKTVLVTGGGGSIGSEICRQLALCSLKKVIIFDIYENNAYELQQELIRIFGDKLETVVEIGSVRDKERLDEVFEKYKPDVVFHAAAHKHVPLMEHCAAEAVKNNVFGTKNTADAAEKHNVKKFILISTDKAVNPTNIMGASKRLCEMIVQSRLDSKTSFACVRFGNVLGSNGSVIPLFRKQIEMGGPVTITDMRIVRYFMTIPEASQLVIQAGALANKGELFVLDMGKPVRIYDLAVNMIKLSGFVPGKDIEIKEIGLRPGEKLYEELLLKDESMTKTCNDKIFIENDTPYTREQIDEMLTSLKNTLKATPDSDSVKKVFKTVVATYEDADAFNREAESRNRE